MRAWVVESITPHGDMDLRDVPCPATPGAGCVVRVEAAGVNFLDALMLRGQYQVKPPVPFTPGIEVVGQVAEAGPGSRFAAGDRVCALLEHGGYAEYAAVPEGAAERLPPEVPINDAAGLTVAYPTAYLALHGRAALQPGEAVLVNGGAGGVGSAAIQLAKHWGARVIAAAGGPEKAALCRELGADAALDYRAEPLADAVRRETGGRGVDVVFDPVGGQAARDSLRCLAWGGRFLVVGFAAGQIPELAANRLLLNGASALGVYWGGHRARDPAGASAIFDALLGLVQAGALRPLVRHSVPLDQARQALEAVSARGTTGKVILTP